MDEQQSEKKQLADSSQEEEQQQRVVVEESIGSVTSSKYNLQYQKILNSEIINYRSKEEMVSVLKTNGITYIQTFLNQQSLSYQIQITKINHTKNYQIIQLTVQTGPFQQQITILNIFKQSFINNLTPLFYGGTTNIYHFYYKDKQYISKFNTFSILNDNHLDVRKQQLMQVIREYCITKIMACLKIGVSLTRDFYFDLVVSESGVQFYLEHCQSHFDRVFGEQDEMVMKTNLKQMHVLGLLHRDIKPNNIMFSKTYNKFVFIDFGISQFKKQTPQQLIKSKFMGTYAYCTNQVKKLFNMKEGDFVNLHFNDAFGLDLSIKQMKKNTCPNYSVISQNKTNELLEVDEFLLRKIKYLLYRNKVEQLKQQLLTQVLSKQTKINTLNFFYQIPATQSLRKFYLFQIEQSIKKQKIYQDLWQCFQTPVYFESFKGNRKFSSIQQRKSNLRFKKIYTHIKNKYTNVVDDVKIIKRQYQNILTNKELIDKFDLFEYQSRLIEYINFKNLKWSATFEQKIKCVKFYIKYRNLNMSQSDFNERQLLEQVLLQICNNFVEKKNVWNYQIILKAIQNYFIVGKKLKIDFNQFFTKFFNQIIGQENTKSITKIQRLLQLIPLRRHFMCSYKKNTSILKTLKLQTLIQTEIKQIINKIKQNDSKEIEICQFLLKAKPFFHFFYQFSEIEIVDIIKQLKGFKKDYPELKKIFSMIQLKVGLRYEEMDKLTEGRLIHQENYYKEFQKQDELNLYVLDIIKLHQNSLQIRKTKRYLNLLDKAINCSQISEQYFIRLRIFLSFYFKDYQYSICLLEKIKYQKYLNQTYIVAVFQMCWITHMQMLNRINFLQLPYQFKNFVQIKQDCLLQLIQMHQKSQVHFQFYFSKNYVYLQLLYYAIFIQHRRYLKKLAEIYKINYSKIIKYNDNKYFKKLMLLDRSEFNLHDNAFMIYFDIARLHQQKKYQEMVEYLRQNSKLFQQILTRQNKTLKSNMLETLGLLIQYVKQSLNKPLLIQCIQLVIPIFEMYENGYLYMLQNHKHHLILTFLEVQKFDLIVAQVFKVAQFYSYHASNTNILTITRFYSLVANSIYDHSKQKPFQIVLKRYLPLLQLKKHYLLSIFLLFFINPSNRQKMINFLYKSLDYMNYQGKYIILTRLYKQLSKRNNITMLRRRYLCKKDLRYPSYYKINLEEMKNRLNMHGRINNFKDRFLFCLEEKLVKFGSNCQIYNESQERTLNGMFTIFDQLYLDTNQKTSDLNGSKWSD